MNTMREHRDHLAAVVLAALFILGSSPARAEWTLQTTGTTNSLWAVDFLDTMTGYAVGAQGNIFKTTDGGATWTNVQDGTSASTSPSTQAPATSSPRFDFLPAVIAVFMFVRPRTGQQVIHSRPATPLWRAERPDGLRIVIGFSLDIVAPAVRTHPGFIDAAARGPCRPA